MEHSVLIVDESELSLRLCSRRLEEITNRSVYIASSYEEAISLLESKEIGCVISEHTLSDKNGIELLNRVKSDYKDISFILYTSFEDRDKIKEFLGNGADDYVSKNLGGCRYEVLSHSVEKNIGLRSQESSCAKSEIESQLFQDIIELVPVGIYVQKSNGEIVLANEKISEMGGDTPEEIVGDNLENSPFTEEEIEKLKEMDQRVLQGEKADIPEIELTDYQGRKRIFSGVKKPFYPSHTDETWIIGTSTEVTENKRHEKMLRKILNASGKMSKAADKKEVADIALETLKNSLGMPLSGFFVYRSEKNVLEPLSVTDECFELFDEIPSLTIDNSLAGTVFKEGESRFFEDLKKENDVQNPETQIKSEIIVPLGNHGIIQSGSLSKKAFTEEQIKLANLFGSLIEATFERTDREKLLREREKQLETQNERLNKFASIISHDLRNPLNVAQGYLEIAEETKNKKDFKEVKEAHNRIDKIIKNILDLTKQKREINMHKTILKEVAEAAWSYSGSEKAKLILNCEKEILADRDKLQQILENLFSNSIEHNESQKVTIEVGETDEGFYVQDNGDGIENKHKKKAFEFGYSESGGTGLGLSIVKDLAESMNWEIDLKESPEGGAKFLFKT